MSTSLISLGLGFGGGKASTSNGRISGGGGAIDGVLLTEASEFLMTEDDNNLALDDLSTFNEYSVDFDGTNDYVDIGGINTALSTAVTFSGWFKFSGSVCGIYSSGNAVSTRVWFALISSTSIRLGVGNGFTDATVSNLGTSWHHIAFTISGTSAEVYLDGGNISSHTVSTTSSNSFTNARLSAFNTTSGAFGASLFALEGNLDEVSMYTTALSSSDISTIYNSGTPADVSSLSPLGWWRMGDSNSGSGTLITDLGSGGNDGTLVNGATIVEDTP